MGDDDFDLNQELLSLQEDREAYCGAVALDADTAELKAQLLEIVDTLESCPTAITTSLVFGKLQDMLKHFSSLDGSVRAMLHNVVLSGLETCVGSLRLSLTAEAGAEFDADRNLLERWIFLASWMMYSAESVKVGPGGVDANEGSGAMMPSSLAKKKKGATKAKDNGRDTWDWANDKAQLMKVLRELLSLPLTRIYHMAAERDAFIGAITKPLYLMIETKDNLKSTAVRPLLFDVLALCIERYHHGFAAMTSIVQALPYFEHLPESMADLVAYVSAKFNASSFADDILIDISKMSFSSQDASAPKAFGAFLVQLAETVPKVVNKKISLLVKHIDSEAYTMRMSAIDMVAKLILAQSNLGQNEGDETAKMDDKAVQSLFDVLEERSQDNNAYVRTRLLQALASIVENNTMPMNLRPQFLTLCLQRLQDKSSAVRRRAIQLLTMFIKTHPFRMDGGQVVLTQINKKLADIDENLQALGGQVGPDIVEEKSEDDDDESSNQDEADKENVEEDNKDEVLTKTPAPSVLDADMVAKVAMLRLQRRYYQDVLGFATAIGTAVPVLKQLMVSNYKTDVIETVIFFTTASEFGLECAHEGVKDMLHLVWSKDDVSLPTGAGASSTAPPTGTSNTKESTKSPTTTAPASIDDIDAKDVKDRTVKDHVISAYQSLFLSEDPALPAKERAQRIAKNLFSLTRDLTLAQLTSLDELLFLMMKRGLVASELLTVLWQCFGSKGDVAKNHRRSAIMLLSMLGRARPEMIADKLDLLSSIGLTSHGMVDPSIALYTCLALQRLNPRQRGAKAKVAGSASDGFVRFAPTHVLTTNLADIVLTLSAPYGLWSQVAEQAIECLYLLTESPDKTCANVIRHLTTKCFGRIAADAENVDPDEPMASSDEEFVPSEMLAKTLFVVGHVAIKQIAHLEAIDRHWKARRVAKEKMTPAATKSSAKKKHDNSAMAVTDELDQVVGAGNAEDDFTELVQAVRESELLFGDESLLAVYGPMVSQICSMPKSFEDLDVQTAAVLCLCKLMCVSAEFCESQLQLLFTLLERSPSEIIRANIVIALGDMAICFSSLIDENISHLYKRLSDSSPYVRNNTLMVLSHLILNGMIKVKGQIAEMAKCLDEPDPKISELAKLFFAEMAAKDNAIYNNLPDIISGLSNGANPLGEDAFRRVIDYIFSFIQKDKQTENLVDKLCNRMGQTEAERQLRDISFCLSRLSFTSDKSIKKLVEGFPLYKDKLHDEFVWNNFNDIVNKARKFQKIETKPVIDDLETKLRECHEKGVDDQQTVRKAAMATKKPTTARRAGGRKAATKQRTLAEDEETD